MNAQPFVYLETLDDFIEVTEPQTWLSSSLAPDPHRKGMLSALAIASGICRETGFPVQYIMKVADVQDNDREHGLTTLKPMLAGMGQAILDSKGKPPVPGILRHGMMLGRPWQPETEQAEPENTEE